MSYYFSDFYYHVQQLELENISRNVLSAIVFLICLFLPLPFAIRNYYTGHPKSLHVFHKLLEARLLIFIDVIIKLHNELLSTATSNDIFVIIPDYLFQLTVSSKFSFPGQTIAEAPREWEK